MKPVPKPILALVSRGRLSFSRKADRWMEHLNLEIEDAESALMEGNLLKKERDETQQVRYKYTIIGPAANGRPVYLCLKVLPRPRGAVLWIMTIHWCDRQPGQP